MILKYTEHFWVYEEGWLSRNRSETVSDEAAANKRAKKLKEVEKRTSVRRYSDFELYEGDKLIKQL